MAFSRCACWSPALRGLFGAMLLAVAGLMACPAGAEIIRKEDTLRGITMTREECAAKPQTLWLNVYGRNYCVRYYLSTAGGEGTRPVIILNGDSNGPIDGKRWTWKNPSEVKDVDTDKLVLAADRFSKWAKTTAIYIARIGVQGTSGSHLARKTLVEVNLMDEALNALRQRYKFEGFHLVGQSGGGRLVFGLAEMRRDIGCLISTSGGLGLVNPGRSDDPARTYFDIDDGLRFLARNRDLRIIVISDPDDKQVPVDTKQAPLVDLLRNEGHKVLHLAVETTDPRHHGALHSYGTVAMGGCVRGKTDDEIMVAIDKVVDKKAEFNRRREDEARGKAASETAFGTERR